MRGDGAAPIDGVLFDFGHTLFAHAPGPEVLLVEARALGVDLQPAVAAAVWQDIELAAMDPAEVALGRDLDAAIWRDRWALLYGRADRLVAGLGAALDRSFHDPWAWVPYADSEPTLRALHDAGVPVGIVSNTGWDVRTAFSVRALDNYITAFTLSWECGVTKPDPAIFEAACAAIAVAPSRTLMVGDDPVADGGAAAAGLADVLLVDPAAPISSNHGLDAVLARALT
ncbi:MAG: hypothetical protein JWN46_3723 [Acidimicrobiales bacterium]|nr:hypothetical protein [Acidimicrobiales bacterium]